MSFSEIIEIIHFLHDIDLKLSSLKEDMNKDIQQLIKDLERSVEKIPQDIEDCIKENYEFIRDKLISEIERERNNIERIPIKIRKEAEMMMENFSAAVEKVIEEIM